jgi:hypothetical protein
MRRHRNQSPQRQHQQQPLAPPIDKKEQNHLSIDGFREEKIRQYWRQRTRKYDVRVIALIVTMAAVIKISNYVYPSPPERPVAPRYIRFIVQTAATTNDEAPAPRKRKVDAHAGIAARVSRLDPSMELYPSKRLVATMSKTGLARQAFINNHSDDYLYGMRDEFETDECQAQYDWQRKSFPTCNPIHEVDLSSIGRGTRQQRMLGHGYWRDVWAVLDGDIRTATVQDDSLLRVLKTMRYQHDYEDRNYDRHRRDAVAMERLARSPMVVDIYAFCANSGLFEYAKGGTLSDQIWPKGRGDSDAVRAMEPINALTRLQLATQAAMGVAAIHNVDKEGIPSLVHTDITPSQFVAIRPGFYKVNDFNRARFLRRNVTAPSSSNQGLCTYQVGRNPGKNRSPEEYQHAPQTEKVDVYSLGNLFYMLLTGLYPFEDVEEEEDAQKQVMKGLRPTFPIEIWNATDPMIQDLKEAMFLCHEQDVKVRATARQVETVLLQSLYRHDPTALQRWGLQEEYGSRIVAVAGS